jgi:hypothetical protein
LIVTIFDVAALSFDGNVITTPVATSPIRQSTSEPTGMFVVRLSEGKLLGVRVDARHF